MFHHHGDEGGGLKLVQHPEGEGYLVHLAGELHSLHCEDLFRDTVIHCKDGIVTMNRMIAGLIFQKIQHLLSLPDEMNLILPDVYNEEMGSVVAKFFEVNGRRIDEDIHDSDSFEFDFVKTELEESSPGVDVRMVIKEEYDVENNETPGKPKYKWSCYICKESFRYAEQLSAHALAQHDTDRPYQCSFCQFTSREKGQLLRHENTHTRAHEFSCELCGKTFLDARDLRNHQTVHSDERNMKCEHCEKSFKSYLYLNRHIKLMHNSSPGELFTCHICAKNFKTKDYLNRHDRKVHGDPKFYVCTFCGKNFKSASHRKDHEEIHRGEADAECEVCGSQVRKKNLERHMKTHSEDADFQCDICAKPLKTVEAFRSHMRSHELPFKCEFCEKPFSTKYSMKSHIVQQHLLKKERNKFKEDKPMIKCDQCNYQCSTTRYMKTHKAVKHDGLLHNCPECSFTTGDMGSLRSHKRAKHEGVVYNCDQCDFKSGYKNNLKNHKAVAHFTVDGLTAFPSMPKQLGDTVAANYVPKYWMDNVP